MLVKAAPGIKVPREEDPRTYITDSEPVELDMTSYYIRRMSDGDLVEASEDERLDKKSDSDVDAATAELASVSALADTSRISEKLAVPLRKS